MLIPINSVTIIAVIIEATTTDRKSHARRLDISKKAPSEIHTLARTREEKRAHVSYTHAHRSYTSTSTLLLVMLCCRYSRGEPSRHLRQGRTSMWYWHEPHNGPLFPRRHVGKNSERWQIFASYASIPWYANI